MADNLTEFPITTKKVSELSAASTLSGTETINTIQSLINKKATVAQIYTYVQTQMKGIAQYYMNNNATATTINTQDVFVKAAGTTSEGISAVNFTVSTNKALYSLNTSANYRVTAMLTASSGNNETIKARIALNGTTQARSEQKIETDGAGDAHQIVIEDIVTLSADTDYIEIFVANGSSTTNITVIDLHVIIEKLH